MTLTEYVDSLNPIVEQARQQYEELVADNDSGVLVAGRNQLSEFTPQDLQAALVQVRQIEELVDEATSAIDPPEQVAELHNLFFDFDPDPDPSGQSDAGAETAGSREERSASTFSTK